MNSEVDLTAAILKYEEPVMYLVLKDNVQLNPAHVREIADSASELSAGKPYLLFSDARVHIKLTPEATSTASDRNLLSLIGASAILVKSWPQKMIANLFIRYSEMPFPTRLFTNASKALSWLEMQKKII